MSRLMPLAVDLVVINSDLDSGFMLLPFLLSEEEQSYLITWQYSKLVTHFFCNCIRALPRKLLVNLQTKQSLPLHIPFSVLSCAHLPPPDRQCLCSVAESPSLLCLFHSSFSISFPPHKIFPIFSTPTQCF